MKVVVHIHYYNEAKTIKKVITDFKEVLYHVDITFMTTTPQTQ